MNEIKPWEYRIETFGGILSQVKDDDLEAALDEWGEEGWEVIAAHNLESTNKVRIIAKRPLTTSSRRRRSWPES
jgi:hypothetical protein